MAKRKGVTFTLSLDLGEGEQRITDAAARAEKIASAAQGFGESLSSVLTAPFSLIAAPALAAAEAYRRATADMRAHTGATGERLDSLVSVLRDVRQTSGIGIGDASRAIADLTRGLDLSGDSLREAAMAVTRVAQASGGAAAGVAGSVVRAMKAFGEADGREVSASAAVLFAAARGSGQGFEAVADQLAAAAPTLRTAGLSLAESGALISDLAARGVPAEKALDALKRAITELVRGGARDIPSALRQHIEAIRGARSTAAAAQMSADLFGKNAVVMSEAIRRGALDFSRLPELLSKISGPERIDSVALAFARLRAAVEVALAPLGTAVGRALESAAGAITGLVGAGAGVAQWFAALPESLQTAVVVVGMLAAMAGPALAFGGVAAGALSGAALAGLKLVGAGRLGLAAALAVLASAAVGMATSCGQLEQEATKVAASAPVAALGEVAAAVQRLPSVAGEDLPATLAKDLAKSGDDMRGDMRLAIEKLTPPRVPLRSIGPMSALAQPAIDTSPVELPPLPSINIPQIPQITAPAAYDWQGEFAQRLGTSSMPSRAMPEFPLFMPPPGADVAGEMRAHVSKVSDWWNAMRGSNLMPIGPLMPGSWFASNTPEEWARRADQLDQTMRGHRQRDDFWAQASQRRQDMDMEAWRRNNEALMSSPYGSNRYGLAQVPMGRPQIYSADDVMSAVSQGWEQAVGGWRPLSDQAGAGRRAPVAAGPGPEAWRAPDAPRTSLLAGEQQGGGFGPAMVSASAGGGRSWEKPGARAPSPGAIGGPHDIAPNGADRGPKARGTFHGQKSADGRYAWWGHQTGDGPGWLPIKAGSWEKPGARAPSPAAPASRAPAAGGVRYFDTSDRSAGEPEVWPTGRVNQSGRPGDRMTEYRDAAGNTFWRSTPDEIRIAGNAPAAPPNLPAIARPSSGPEFLRMEGQKYVYSGADATGRRHEIKTEIPYMRPIGIEDFKRARRAFEAVGRLDPDIAARVKVLAKFNPRAAQDPDVAWALKESLKPAGVR